MRIIGAILVFLAFMALSLSPLWAEIHVKEPRGYNLTFGERSNSFAPFSISPRKGWANAGEIHCVGFDGLVRHSNFYFPAFVGTYTGSIYIPTNATKCYVKESR